MGTVTGRILDRNFTLDTQGYLNAIHRERFTSICGGKNATYYEVTKYKFLTQ